MKKRNMRFILLTFLFCNIFLVQSVLYSTGNVKIPLTSDVGGSIMPSNLTGIIVLWNGNLSSIPNGWALCDGDNGTPNLTDRFVMSVGEFENPGVTGGAINHTHSYKEIPYHDHSISDPGHRHLIYEKDGLTGPRGTSGTTLRAFDYNIIDQTYDTKINFNPDPAGIENCVTENSSTIPSYIKLSYIMKKENNQNSILPANTILGWINPFNSIPEGWILCDGSSFSPNVTERFIQSTGNESEIEATGGSNTHKHQYTDLPLHDHDVDIDYHNHQQNIPQRGNGILTGSDINTLSRNTYSSTSTVALSGITIQNSGNTDCETLETESLPPYFKMAFITCNESTSYLPNKSIYWWSGNLHNIPQYSEQFVGISDTTTVFNRFLLPTANESLIGNTGGANSHSHTYSQIPRHTHTYKETSHSHTYKRAYNTLYGVSTASTDEWVSNPTVTLVFTSYSSSRVDILPKGTPICHTDNSSSLPPYYKLGFIQATGDLVQVQPSNPIELDWYWWMIIGSIGSLAIVVTISMLIRRKKRKSESIDKK